MVTTTSGVQMKLFRVLALVFVTTATAVGAFAAESGNELLLSQRAANAAIARWPGGRINPAASKWAYELGALLQGVDAVWLNTADSRYYNYIKTSIDQY